MIQRSYGPLSYKFKYISSSILLFSLVVLESVQNATLIIHEHTGVGEVLGMGIGKFKVIGRFGHFKLLCLFTKQF